MIVKLEQTIAGNNPGTHNTGSVGIIAAENSINLAYVIRGFKKFDGRNPA